MGNLGISQMKLGNQTNGEQGLVPRREAWEVETCLNFDDGNALDFSQLRKAMAQNPQR